MAEKGRPNAPAPAAPAAAPRDGAERLAAELYCRLVLARPGTAAAHLAAEALDKAEVFREAALSRRGRTPTPTPDNPGK